jgi:hypothetical protein
MFGGGHHAGTGRPIDVISANRPILILDEPQKMEGAATLKSLEEFKALMVLRYSATHKTTHNKIHRLDALDAYTIRSGADHLQAPDRSSSCDENTHEEHERLTRRQ